MTASNDADFFKRHTDSSLHEGRTVSFVYYFYREPKAFTGGELRVYDTRVEGDRIVGGRKYDTIIPRQNQMLFFPSYLFHEVLPVRCPSQKLADSRFTVNGWISRK
jgi:Rps23 Pro-64 3,4-dihydroxylase Tpa1-like proline 4-hydroxylase